jgi:hypothetical protein
VAFGYTPPEGTPGNYSQVFTQNIDDIGPKKDIYHDGWASASVGGPDQYGQGIVYGRIFAHEMASHGMLGYLPSDPGDASRGFLGEGPRTNKQLFRAGLLADATFSLTPAQGGLLNTECWRRKGVRPIPVNPRDARYIRPIITRLPSIMPVCHLSEDEWKCSFFIPPFWPLDLSVNPGGPGYGIGGHIFL